MVAGDAAEVVAGFLAFVLLVSMATLVAGIRTRTQTDVAVVVVALTMMGAAAAPTEGGDDDNISSFRR